MKTWAQFLPYVLEDVKDVPKQFAENAIRDAVIEFCERSFLWIIRSDPSDLLVGESLYGFNTPAGTKMIRINRVEATATPTAGYCEVVPIAYEEFLRKYPNYSTITSSYPTHYIAQEPGIIMVFPTPTADVIGGIKAEISIAPTRLATACPDFIFEQYAEAIGFGAKSKLMLSTNKPWSNAEAGMLYEQKFRAGISKAEARTRKAKANIGLTVQPRQFGG